MNVLLTGCSRGLGFEIASTLVRAGYVVYGVSRTLSSEYEELIKQNPARVFFLSMDLSNTDMIQEQVFKSFIPNSTPLLGLINNAATAYDDIITNLELSKLEEMYRVNVFAPLLLTKYAIRNMIFNQTKGSIVNISSISAHTGYKGLAMYASTKGALEAFSNNTAREWGNKGIRSNCVVPGFMETEMSASLPEESRQKIYNRSSLKAPTDLKSVASTVAFLLSEGSTAITGQSINVDSGVI